MRKIPNLFERDADGNLTERINPVARWVVDGEGLATVKYDGTACMIRGGVLYKRYDCKRGKTPPDGFEPCQDPDDATGHWPGWVPVTDSDKWHRAADTPDRPLSSLPDGTYELCGPKVNGNPEGLDGHCLLRHGQDVMVRVPRDRAGLIEFLSLLNVEGIVWHHPDGRMVKVRKHDLGLRRTPEEVAK